MSTACFPHPERGIESYMYIHLPMNRAHLDAVLEIKQLDCELEEK